MPPPPVVSPCSAAASNPSPLARLPPSQHASLCTRQGASAFNQPLTFDTSSVTSMRYMFAVRLRTCPILQLDGPHMLP